LRARPGEHRRANCPLSSCGHGELDSRFTPDIVSFHAAAVAAGTGRR
jgi:hypothetical protein